MAPEHPLIPFDILDEIVYFLHDDHTTLRALALVSEILLPRCRRLLFHRTDLRIDHPGNYILINLFIDHPEIRTYIQTLSLSLVTPAYPTGQQDLSYYVGAFKVLQFLICELDHIEHFVLEDFYWNGTIAKQMNPSIRRILALPSLKAITFRNVTNLPLTCLYYCRYLTQLEFDLVEFTENLSVFEGPAPDSNVIHLKSLSVNNDKIYPERPFVAAAVSGFLDGEKQRIDVSHLDHVSIFAAGNSDGQFFWKIVRKTATSLRSLSLICNGKHCLVKLCSK
ncbi:hypothetical protein B0H34DRAFT_420055 [Crassisporium funariophilum]|nr:hypothetical protein B0H34DRAFT_420055 [Crassisporium funariophilum]